MKIELKVSSWCPVVLPVVLWLALLLWAFPLSLRAQENRRHIGIYHPHPRFCVDQELSQRDLRVLRLAFGVFRTPGERRALPWFYELRSAGPGGEGGFELALRTRALWDVSPISLMGGDPDFPQQNAADRLEAWRRRMLDAFPGFLPAPFLSVAQLQGRADAPPPLFYSRLAQSRLLPQAVPGANGLEGNVEGHLAETPLLIEGAVPREMTCRSWPRNITMEPGKGRYSYRLRHRNREGKEDWILSGFRNVDLLWRDYHWGRLEALLLEGPDLGPKVSRYRSSQLGAWGVSQGGQQIVLRLHPKLKERLGSDGRLALSLALGRKKLGGLEGPGRFGAATSFLVPILEKVESGSDSSLRYNTLQARRLWLTRNREIPAELRLSVLQHPWLERLARAVGEHWRRTLNLKIRVEALPPDLFYRMGTASEPELRMEVVDLDDGSLQDLWQESLGEVRAGFTNSPSQWEALLREELPYLPLVANLHYVLLKKKAKPDLLPRICPDCRVIRPPLKLAPEYRPRVNPEG